MIDYNLYMCLLNGDFLDLNGHGENDPKIAAKPETSRKYIKTMVWLIIGVDL